MTLPRARWRRWLLVMLLVGAGVYLVMLAALWRHATGVLAQLPLRPADAALVLGSRAYVDGQPNPCLTGRVDAALVLARAGTVLQLAFTGGVDREDGSIEADVMRAHALQAGYAGPVLVEGAATSTRENLSLSWPLLQAAGVRSVIVVSEPFHLWRAQRLASASGFDQAFDVQYAAAATPCWRRGCMFFKGALREPLAIVNNALHGYL